MKAPGWAWLGHATVMVRSAGGRTLYVDPFDLRERDWPPADLVLVTNPRAGYLSPEDIAAVRGEGAPVAGPPDAVAGLPPPARALRPGEELSCAGFRVVAFSSYTPGSTFFPRDAGWLGYRILADDRTLVHAGACGPMPELRDLRADVAFLPVSGRTVMDEGEAAAAADAMGARERAALLAPGDRFRPVAGFTVRS